LFFREGGVVGAKTGGLEKRRFTPFQLLFFFGFRVKSPKKKPGSEGYLSPTRGP